jgi:uncharacterized membrane protein
MPEKKTIMSELIFIGYEDKPTAFLARATMARVQDEFGLQMQDMAIVTKQANGQISLELSRHREIGENKSAFFWEILIDRLSNAGSPKDKATHVEFGENATVMSLDPVLVSDAANILMSSQSALFVKITTLAQREKVVGILQGFAGELRQIPLSTEKFNAKSPCG